MARRGSLVLTCNLLCVACVCVFVCSGCHLIFPFTTDTPGSDSTAPEDTGTLDLSDMAGDRTLGDQTIHPDQPAVDLSALADLAPLDASPDDQGSGCPSSITVAFGNSCSGGQTPIGGGISCTGGAVNSSWPSLAGWDGTCTGTGTPTIQVICATNAPPPSAHTPMTPGLSATATCKTGEKLVNGGCQCASGKLLTSMWASSAWKCECSEIGLHTAWAFCVSSICTHSLTNSAPTDLSSTSKHTSVGCQGLPRVGGGATIYSTDPPNMGLVRLGPKLTDIFEAIAEPTVKSGLLRTQVNCVQ